MAVGSLVSLSFDDLNALLCALQHRHGLSSGEPTDLGRRLDLALHDRLERLQYWDEDRSSAPANDPEWSGG